MITNSKALPPRWGEKSRWQVAKDRVSRWLAGKLFPPSETEYYDFDHLDEQYAAEEERKRRLYPIRWSVEKVWEWVSRWPRVENLSYWVRSRVWRRDHLLDLREAERSLPEGYRWGALDPCAAMELAMFACLLRYWEHGDPVSGGPLTDPAGWYPDASTEDVEAEAVRSGSQVWQYRECRDLVQWWRRGRFEEKRAQSELYERYKRTAKTDPDYEQVTRAWLDGEHALDVRATEMRVRLARLCPYLWA